MSTSASDPKRVLERYVAAFEAGDEAVIRESFAETATWQLSGDLPISGVWRGRDAIINDFLGAALAYFEPGSLRLQITSLIAEGERVAMEWTSRARTVAGVPFENAVIAVFTVRDGRIESVREYMDTEYARRIGSAEAA